LCQFERPVAGAANLVITLDPEAAELGEKEVMQVRIVTLTTMRGSDLSA
jgi:hypothetical protein